jgi:hypothetical protein
MNNQTLLLFHLTDVEDIKGGNNARHSLDIYPLKDLVSTPISMKNSIG